MQVAEWEDKNSAGNTLRRPKTFGALSAETRLLTNERFTSTPGNFE